MTRSTLRTATLAVAASLMLSVVPQIGTGEVRHHRAVPLMAPAPAWYSDALHARVLAAGARGVALPADAQEEIPASSLAFLGIRPGQLLIIDGGTLCSSNFVFSTSEFPTLLGTSLETGGGRKNTRSNTNGKRAAAAAAAASSYYIGTAGHCGKVGDPVTMLFLPLGLVHIGTIVQSTDGGIGNDFALIAIDPALNNMVSPSMAHWGGPTGVYGGGPITVHHAGWGLGVGTGGTPRAGVGYLWTSGEWRFEGVIAPGDSGSGAIVTGGLGAGNITHIVIDSRETVPAFMAGTSMTRIMSMVGGLRLATCAPVPWPAPGCPVN